MNRSLAAIGIALLWTGALFAFDTAREEEVTAGGWHTCVLADDKVQCWGANEEHQLEVPPLARPAMVSAGGEHTCAIDDKGVVCWGANRFGQARVPKDLSRATWISAGQAHSCAVAGENVVCWGYNEFGQASPPRLNRATQVAAGFRHTCALDADGVQCWGDGASGELDVPPLSRPRQVVSGDGFSCAVDDEGVKCWGEKSLWSKEPALGLNRVLRLSAGRHHVCAITDVGSACWGYDHEGQASPPPLVNPESLSAGGYHSCAIDDEGIKCWGSKAYRQVEAPTDLIGSIFSFHLKKIERTLDRLASYSYHYRGDFYRKLARFIEKYPMPASGEEGAAGLAAAAPRLFLVNAIGPVLTDTAFFKEYVLENYARNVPRWNARFNVSGLGAIPRSAEVEKLAVVMARAALQAARGHVAQKTSSGEIDEWCLALGRAEARLQAGMSETERHEVLAAADLGVGRHAALMDRLIQENRSQGFGVLLRTIDDYLAGSKR